MNKKIELLHDIVSRDFPLIKTKYTPQEIVHLLDFQSCMFLTDGIYDYDLYNYQSLEYPRDLCINIKQTFPLDWNKDWKNEAYLGQLYDLTWEYEEKYACYKKAYDMLKDPPDCLLLRLAGCNSMPGEPCISDEESENYLQRAVRKKVTAEAAIMMRALYRHKKNREMEEFWDKLYSELDKNNIHTDPIMPDLLLNRT